MNDYERAEFGRIFLPAIAWLVEAVNRAVQFLRKGRTMFGLDWSDPLERGAGIFLGLVIPLCALMTLGLIIGGSVTARYEKVCLEAGYPETQYARGNWYCIGIRDGSSVTVPVGEVGR